MDERSKLCPNCREPVKPNWTFCPACEASLDERFCPNCKSPVKQHWTICPECETRLFCKSCGKRFSPETKTCPECEPEVIQKPIRMPEFTEPSTGMEFVFVPGGDYQMGDLYGDGLETELPVHTVHLDNFYMGKYPVTQAQWEQLMKDNPSRFKKDDRPVEQVNWYDIQEFIKRLSRFHGGKYRFFLPSEAQWEFAARSGGKEEKYSGSDIPEPVAWYDDNSDGHTRPVGEKLPNGLGLFDMSGNVWEWCRDAYVDDAYHFHRKNNPLVGEEGPDRVIRGGSWNMNAWCARCFRRFGFRSEDAGPGVGCRLVMIP